MLEQLKKLYNMLASLRMDPRIQLLASAQQSIGVNFPGDDVYGCAIAVNKVVEKAFGSPICYSPSTTAMYFVLTSNSTWLKVNDPLPGDICISPTGYGNGTLKNGHVGVIEYNGKILSNDSITGKFGFKYDIITWKQRYVDLGGFPVYYFRRIKN